MSARKGQRRKKSAAARLRPFWFLIAIVAIIAAGAGYWAATWPGFYPQSVAVSGNRIVPSQQILERAAIARDRNVWLQDMHAAGARVERIPYIQNARIHRMLPAAVTIRVTERSPFAVIRYGDQDVLVDRDLRVLQTGGGDETLPVFEVGAAAAPAPGTFLKNAQTAQLREDYDELSRAHVATATFRYDRFGDLIVVTRGGVKLLLGDESDLARKAALVAPILSQVAAQGRKISAVDLRAPRTPVVVYRQK